MRNWKVVAGAAIAGFVMMGYGPSIDVTEEEASENEEQTAMQEWAANEPRIICETFQQTGTRIRGRRCRTEGQLTEEREDSVETIREINEMGSQLR